MREVIVKCVRTKIGWFRFVPQKKNQAFYIPINLWRYWNVWIVLFQQYWNDAMKNVFVLKRHEIPFFFFKRKIPTRVEKKNHPFRLVWDIFDCPNVFTSSKTHDHSVKSFRWLFFIPNWNSFTLNPFIPVGNNTYFHVVWILIQF